MNTVSGSGPSKKTRVLISALPQGFPYRPQTSYVVHTMALVPVYWSCPDLKLWSVFSGDNYRSRDAFFPLLRTVKTTQPHLSKTGKVH